MKLPKSANHTLFGPENGGCSNWSKRNTTYLQPIENLQISRFLLTESGQESLRLILKVDFCLQMHVELRNYTMLQEFIILKTSHTFYENLLWQG